MEYWVAIFSRKIYFHREKRYEIAKLTQYMCPKSPQKERQSLSAAPYAPHAKLAMLATLLVCFIAQTLLVYADSSHPSPLSESAVLGRKIWHERNCQACHQTYGFGGFLGPDLTNVAQRLDFDQFLTRLAQGQDQMPIVDLEPDQALNLWQYLEEVSLTGIGEARSSTLRGTSAEGHTRVQDIIGSALGKTENLPAIAGSQVFFTNTCKACHTLFTETAVGGADLSLVAMTSKTDEIRQVLINGKLPKMPPTNLDEQSINELIAFFEYLSANREELWEQSKPKSIFEDWASIPWWEFE